MLVPCLTGSRSAQRAYDGVSPGVSKQWARVRLGAAEHALEAGGARRLWNESFFSAPQLKRNPLGSTRVKDEMLRSAVALVQTGLRLPCWQVRWDNQVGLDMNFGNPHLVIRHPRSSASKSPRVQALAARRRVHLHGTHWLQVAPEAWEIVLADGTRARRGASARQCDIACARLSGERLLDVEIDTKTGASEFRFDLGAI